jgi:hypothetical protein
MSCSPRDHPPGRTSRRAAGSIRGQERRAIRVRPDAEKNERYRYLHLPDELFAALLRTPRRVRIAIQTLHSPPTSGTPPAYGDRARLPGRRGAALLAALASAPARLTPLQAHRLARRNRRAPGRLEASRRRPLCLCPSRLQRGREQAVEVTADCALDRADRCRRADRGDGPDHIVAARKDLRRRVAISHTPLSPLERHVRPATPPCPQTDG